MISFMLFRLMSTLAAILLWFAAPAMSQEVMPAARPAPSCSADKISDDLTMFIGPEDRDSAPLRAEAAAEPGSIVGSLLPPAAMRQREEAFGR
jgi:hypothetical protein